MPRTPKDFFTPPTPASTNPETAPTINVAGRRWKGVFLTILSVILFIALVSYDWHDIPWLCNPVSPGNNGLAVNRLGSLGAWLTFYGYGFAGLAYRYFAIPLLLLVAGFMLHGKVKYQRLRLLWITLLYLALACLFQTIGGDAGENIPLLATLNIRPNAGGAIGQWVVSDCLRPLIGTMGLHLLLWPLILALVLLIIGVRNALCLVTRLITPVKPVALSPGVEALAQQYAAREQAHATETQPKGNFLTNLFKRKPEAPVAAPIVPSTTEILHYRATTAAQGWVPPARAKTDAPLFQTPKEPTPTPAPAPIPVEEAPKPFTLTADDEQKLKPISPAKTITAPVPAANDNTEEVVDVPDYGLPPLELLGAIPPRKDDTDDVQSAIAAIEGVFEQFRIPAKVVNYKRGPVLTQFEIRPDASVDLKKFEGTRRNLLMHLRAESIRIQAPIPGRDLVGIEVPNSTRQSVTLREILEGSTWKKAEKTMELPLAMGKLATGGDLIVDLAEMPHLLVAGGTGSGKSVAVNDMLIGLLMCRKPDRLRLLMVDPKRVEFTSYDNLPHLLNPVVVEPKKVVFTLRWAKMEMERRYQQLQKYGVRNIGEYNNRVDHPLADRDNPINRLPFIVLIIDELADLMNDPAVRAEIETPIAALTAKARAAGIHLIIATQRPTTDIITGTIKSNIPGRVALRVAQGNDSRTILDETGAENLIGKGDMLLGRSGKPTVRSQAAWVTNDSIDAICNYIRNQAGPAFDNVLAGTMERIQEEKASTDISSLLTGLTAEPKPEPTYVEPGSDDDTSDEGYYLKALDFIRQTGRFSTSALQRKFRIGYSKAGRITDMLEERGIIGPATKAGGSREILVDLNAEERQKLAGTDGETAAFDTRTADEGEPSFGEPAEASASFTTEMSTDTYADSESFGSAPSPEEDFDLGDFDPAALGIPDVTHPTHAE